jgi:hypothetical protein
MTLKAVGPTTKFEDAEELCWEFYNPTAAMGFQPMLLDPIVEQSGGK